MSKMWSPIVLCLLVGFVFASENPGWDSKYHYEYKVYGRSLAGLNQVSNDYSGIFFKAKLYIQPRSDGNLGAKISNAQYAKVHQELEDGWETEVPESQLQYQQLPLTSKPFQIVLHKGAIRNVVVDKSIKNWEANMIKSVVSQLQLDTKATNLIPSSINILTQEESNTAVFKTMEETVTGVAETLYEIHPYPEYVLQSKPWTVPHKHLIESVEGGEIIEVVKTKNFTHSEEFRSYHAGLQGISGYQPGNKVGNFLSRSALTQAVITGTLSKYTIQSSVTVEEIVLNPALANQEKGSVFTKLNTTLANVAQPIDENEYEVSNPVETGVVYAYNNPFSTDNSPRQQKEYDHAVAPSSAESEDSDSQLYNLNRHKRSISGSSYSKNFAYASYQPDSVEEEDWHQDKPSLNDAPASPLLPFTVGHDGQSIKKHQNIVETVRKLAEQIGQEFENSKDILRQDTIGKFVTLTSLCRIMNKNEIQEAANQLYSQNQGQKNFAWVAFRDAVAQSGTGPALVNIKEWILSKKIREGEAAYVIASAADSARHPTEEYMKFFNEMIQNEQIMQEKRLNESALLSYTTLVQQVYANRRNSHSNYPVYSFGSFRTVRGQEYVRNTVIPHLTRKLNEAIQKADTQQAHIYIRALGNIAEQHILESFKPYLEGDKKASHFQRVLMVVALDQLVKSNPKVARSVLYKIYQNPSEFEQVRVAAVYQLMRTQPEADMLQRMAQYTNEDASNYVNAAVKSCIESAADLESPEHDRLREAARSAQPLLTSEEYGAQYSQGFLRSYFINELEMAYKQDLQTFNGEDHVVPNGFKYILQRQLGGVNQEVINAQALVSSVEDLYNVFQQQTKEYQRQQQEKQQVGASNTKWSSEYVAKLLNLQNEQREQLEGNLYLQVGAMQSFLSFDNQTFEDLPEQIQRWENELKQGKQWHYNKMLMGQESTLALPTSLGLPFIYTYDQPALVQFEGSLKANAQPQISAGHVLQKPDTVSAEFDINAVISGKIQAQLGIFTPFDHQRYSAGYHKNFQLNVPLTGNLQLDVQTKQLKVELQNPGNQENVRLAHYSTWPYTAQNNIYTPKPELNIIHSKQQHKYNTVVGDKSTGVAVYLQITSDKRVDLGAIYDRLCQHDPISAILNAGAEQDIQYMQVDVGIDSAKSTAQQVNLELGYMKEYKSQQPRQFKDNDNQISDIPAFPEDSEKRQQDFVDRLSKDVPNAKIFVVDANAEFQGQNKIKYSFTAGASKSDVAPHGRFMAYAKKAERQNPQVQAYVQGTTHAPNTNGLDMDYAMQMDPTTTAVVQGLLRNGQRLSRVDAQVHLSKTQQRVEYLKQQPQYQECHRQMQQGNTQLPICAIMTSKANLLDKFSIKMKYENMDSRVINATYKAYSLLRQNMYPRVEENILESGSDDRLDIQGRFSPDLHYVNVSINSEYGQAQIRNAKVGQWTRQWLVPHPVFHTRARLYGEALKHENYRPICVVDKTATSTWDNKTYESNLSNQWTVVHQYVPRRPSPVNNKPDQSVPEQLHQDVESYVVYARNAEQSQSQKEIKIVFQMPCTQGQVVKILMKPSTSNSQPKVLLNEQEVKYNAEQSSDYYKGSVQIYALPNQEVKLEVRDAFYAIFNGQTLKLVAVNSKFRDASRGLCGTFTGEQETDFVGPDNCIIHSSERFVESYTIGQQPESRIRSRQASGDSSSSEESRECHQKKVNFAKYISNEDAGRSTDSDRRVRGSCTKHQTRYVQQNGQICFTLRPLPVCKSHCRSSGFIVKNVEVHCASKSSATSLWKNEIDKGASPDFSLKDVTRTIEMQMPQKCLP